LPEKQKPETRFGSRVAPAVAGVIAGVAVPATAHAGTVLSNLGDPDLTEVRIELETPVAQAFLTGPLALTVHSIVIELVPEKGVPQGDYTVSLYTDLSGSPGSDIGDSAPVNSSIGDVDFVFASPVALAANTKYWVVASNTVECVFHCANWVTTASAAETSDVGATFQGDLETFNGTSWVNASGSPSVGLTAIDAPEPGGFSLAAHGGALIAWIDRRKKRSRTE